jgi:hypothetical protein
VTPREKRPGSAKTTRLRKVECTACGYTVRMSRKWIECALPDCPNPDCSAVGTAMTCPEAADQILADPELLESLPRPIRTAICRENGWEAEIIRTSPGPHGGLGRAATATSPARATEGDGDAGPAGDGRRRASPATVTVTNPLGGILPGPPAETVPRPASV